MDDAVVATDGDVGGGERKQRSVTYSRVKHDYGGGSQALCFVTNIICINIRRQLRTLKIGSRYTPATSSRPAKHFPAEPQNKSWIGH